jgi:hypothetical protein
LKRIEATPVLGTIFLVQLAGLYVMDWWFHFDPGDASIRFWPRIVRAAFVIQILVYSALHARRIAKLRVAKFQLLWLGILIVRFLFHGNFDGEVDMYMVNLAYWVLVLWSAYSLVVDGNLTARQVTITGAVMTFVVVMRNALFGFAGIWLGNKVEGWSFQDIVFNSAYPLLWFTLMQTVDTDVPLTGPIALLGAVAIVLTMKRGAFIALLLAALAYGMTYAYINRKSRGIRRVVAFAGIVVVAIGIPVWLRGGEIAARWTEVEDPNNLGSGRGIFWLIIAQHWLSADVITKFIGFGPHSVFEITGDQYLAAIPAHNDWLNMLHEFGIVGVLALGAVCWALVKGLSPILRDCPKFAPLFCAALSGALCITLFDIFSSNSETSFFSLLIAVPLGMSARARLGRVRQSVPRKSVSKRPFVPGRRAAAQPSALPET